MKSLNKKILAFPITLLCLLAGFAVCSGTVRAAEHSDFEVTGGTVTFDETDQILTVSDGPVTIKNLNDITATQHRIHVDGDTEVTLEGVNIDASGKAGSAFSIADGKRVTLILEPGSSNVLMSSGDYAGLHVPSNASLTISGPGSLEAKCVSEAGYANGAGIGGNGDSSGKGTGGSGGTVTIKGGTVTAYCTATRNGNATGSGIGGGGSEHGTGGSGGTVTIEGGVVTAKCEGEGNINGAGIGGGGSQDSIGGAGGSVSIKSGVVTAKCEGGDNTNGAGIGGGGSQDSIGGAGGSVSIKGGVVTAKCENKGSSRSSGAGIGGGGAYWSYNKDDVYGGAGGRVIIEGGTVTAKCESMSGAATGAGIGGGGYKGNGGAVIIDGGNINAAGAEKIGCGTDGTSPGTLKNSEGDNLSLVTLDTITHISYDPSVADLWVGDYRGNVTPDANQKHYGISDMEIIDKYGIYLYLPETISQDDFVLMVLGQGKDKESIYTGKIEQVPESTDRRANLYNGIDLSCFPGGRHLFIGEKQFAISPDGASGIVNYTGDYTLKGGSSKDPINSRVTVLKEGIDKDKSIKLDGLHIDVSANSNACAFAIEAGAQVSLRLTDAGGTNNLISGANRAGLNVPDGASLEVITSEAILNAVCKAERGEAAGAGIGGNKGEKGGKVTIKGGAAAKRGGVNAICQADTGNAGGAGIGGGAGGAGGEVTIEGSTITAGCQAPKGTANGAGIGGGENGDGGTVIIDGGNVKAVGGLSAENIGRGHGGGDSGSLKNSNGEDVYLNVFSLDLSGTRSTIDTLMIDYSKQKYGILGVHPLDISTGADSDEVGKLYFYLPPSNGKGRLYLEYSETVSVELMYTRSYTRKAQHMSEDEVVRLLRDTPYKVTIPAEISFDSLSYKKSDAADRYSLKSFGINATGLGRLVDGRSLSVRVSSPDNKFTMAEKTGGKEVSYQVFKGDEGNADFTRPLRQNDAAVQGFRKDDEGLTKYATLRLDQSQLRFSGDYEGTLTFTVNIDDTIE